MAALLAPLAIAAGAETVETPASSSTATPSVAKHLDRITVTAERRENDPQLVPAAVTVFDAEELRLRDIDEPRDIATRTPGMAMGSFNTGQPQIYIRGIGSNEDGPAGDASVGVFVDDVYLGRTAAVVPELLDLKRVEVLRGPQGTLYGKNVTGGLLHYVTNDPTDQLEQSLESSVGNLDSLAFRGYLNVPIVDSAAARVAVSHRRRDGYLDSRIDRYPDYFPDSDPDELGAFDQLDEHRDALRAKLRWDPLENLESVTSVDVFDLRESGPARHWTGGLTGSLLDGLIEDYEGDIRQNLTENPGYTDIQVWGVSHRLRWRGRATELTSISAWRESDASVSEGFVSDRLSDLYLSSPNLTAYASFVSPGQGNFYDENAQQFSQELRLASSSTSSLQWVAGAYYLWEDVDRLEGWNLGLDLADGMGGTYQFAPVSTGSADMHARNQSVAGFADATWFFLERWSLTAGLRYTWETKDFDSTGMRGGLNLIAEDYRAASDHSWNDWTPRVALEFFPTDSASVYALVSKGFKSGGYQGQPPTAISAMTPFDQETAWNHEIGAKTQWFDNRARMNVSAFYIDYSDLQVLQLLVPETAPDEAPGVLVTQNAADAEVFGVEVEYALVPLRGLYIEGSYAWLDATFTDFSVPAGFRLPDGATGVDRDGNRLRNAPEHSLHLLARYEYPLSYGAVTSLQAEWRYQGKTYQDPDNLDRAAIDAFDITDLRLAYRTADDNWELAGWVHNLFDEDYFLHNYPVADSGVATPAPPRTYGVTLTYRFQAT